jgi:Sodium/hydrogen exchanger family
VIPVLKDAGQVGTPLGQLVVAGASIAEIATIVLLSLFFSGEATGVGAKLLLLGLFGLFVLAVGVAVLGAEQSMRISATLLRLQDTTAEIRIRAAFLLLAVFVVLAERLGLEAILGAFLAGAILKLVDRDQMLTHPQFRQRLRGGRLRRVRASLLRRNGASVRLTSLLRVRMLAACCPNLRCSGPKRPRIKQIARMLWDGSDRTRTRDLRRDRPDRGWRRERQWARHRSVDARLRPCGGALRIAERSGSGAFAARLLPAPILPPDEPLAGSAVGYLVAGESAAAFGRGRGVVELVAVVEA